MTTPTLTTAINIKLFDGQNASERDYAAVNRFYNRINAERLPDDPPVLLEETIADFRNIPPVIMVKHWAAWNEDESQIVAMAGCWLKATEDNRHLLGFWLNVLPEYRRQGLARRLLAFPADVAVREQRHLMQAHTHERVPAGEAFMRRLGAKMGLAEHTNQLVLSELDRDLIKRWIEQAKERASDFELKAIVGRYPDDQVEALADLFHVMNTMPRDNLQMEDWTVTPEQLRQFEQSMFARGNERWTMLVRHKPGGELAGFTETVWNPHRPEMLEQEGTGVLPKYRNHGLGRWLKAAMIEKVLRERPQVKRIRTGNADSNAPMLKINYELGFKPYQSMWTWQIETGKVLQYLGRG